jgi:WhiB family redox-sensing transcriptional regulator
VGALEDLLGKPAWHADALCQEYPMDWFFPERGKTVNHAKAVCGQCLVRQECLEFALSDPDAFHAGIWAGTSGRDRRKLRQKPREHLPRIPTACPSCGGSRERYESPGGVVQWKCKPCIAERARARRQAA